MNVVNIYKHGRTWYIVVTAEKGGEGKSTTAVNLADMLAAAGYEVLVIDLDSQGNVATSLGLKPESGIMDMFMGRRTQRELIRHTRNPRLDIIPGNVDTQGVHGYITSMARTPTPLTPTRIAEIFRNVAGDKEELAEGEKRYNVVIFDVPKEGDELRKGALLCAAQNGAVIIPVKPERLGMQDVQPMLEILGPEQPVIVLPTMVRNTSSHKGALMVMKKWWGEERLVFNGEPYSTDAPHMPLTIPLETCVTEASAAQQTLREYNAKCKASTAYDSLATHIAKMMEATQYA